MSKQHRFSLPVYSIEHTSGTPISYVSFDIEDRFLNKTPRAIAQDFSRAVKKHFLNEGDYAALVRYFPRGQCEKVIVKVSIPANEKRFEDDVHHIKIELLVWHFEDGSYLASIPALSLGYHGKKIERLEEGISSLVLLNFRQEKRLESYQDLIAAQWYKSAELDWQDIQLTIYTAAELENIAKGEQERLLPKTATRMNRAQQQFFGFDAFLTELKDNLQGQYKQSILIVGPPGCGKTALVQAYEKQVGKDWQKKPWLTSAPRMLQVLTESGSWQYGFGQWVTELRESGEVVYIGNLSEWFEVGQYSGNSISIAEAMRDPLQRNEILIIAEATQEQLDRVELRSPGFSELFHVVHFKQRSADEEDAIAVAAVKNIAGIYNIRIAENVIQGILQLHRRYTPYSGYPGKTIRFFESLLLQKNGEQNVGEQKDIMLNDALDAFVEESGMPRFLIDQKIAFDEAKAKAFFRQRVIGQQQAIDELTDTILTTKAGLSRAGRPIISLLFVGPTGVGKTQLAKTLAEYIFSDENRMLRFDMSEYSDPTAVLRMTAANESSLVAKVRQQPFSVVLFDEIEKAAYNFFDLLLQVLAEGRLSDDKGEVANFCSTIIIMTSNLGAQEYMKPSMGFRQNDQYIDDHFENVVTQHFRPELFNRIDRILPFSPLNQAQKASIVRIELASLLNSHGLVNRPVIIEEDDSLRDWINGLNIDFRYGARAIQRQLQEKCLWPLAEGLCEYPWQDAIELQLQSPESPEAAVKVNVRRMQTFKKSLSLFSDLSDEIAQQRRTVQGLQDGSTWIGLMSEIDKIEREKTRLGERFWQNPKMVQHYTLLNNFVERFQTCREDIFDLEHQCLSQLNDERPDELWQDYQDQLHIQSNAFQALLFDLESCMNDEANRLILSVYGAESELALLDDFYMGMFDYFEHRVHRYRVYYLKGEYSVEKIEAMLDRDIEDRVINDCLNNDEEDERLYSYWKSQRELRHKSLKHIGYIYAIEGECAQHFYHNEVGIHAFIADDDEKDVRRCYAEVASNNVSEYCIPEGIERKDFLKNIKQQRFIRHMAYTDKRFPDSVVSPTSLRDHSQKILAKVADRLQQKLVKRNRIEG